VSRGRQNRRLGSRALPSALGHGRRRLGFTRTAELLTGHVGSFNKVFGEVRRGQKLDFVPIVKSSLSLSLSLSL
jgi:hypothetical protein